MIGNATKGIALLWIYEISLRTSVVCECFPDENVEIKLINSLVEAFRSRVKSFAYTTIRRGNTAPVFVGICRLTIKRIMDSVSSACRGCTTIP